MRCHRHRRRARPPDSHNQRANHRTNKRRHTRTVVVAERSSSSSSGNKDGHIPLISQKQHNGSTKNQPATRRKSMSFLAGRPSTGEAGRKNDLLFLDAHSPKMSTRRDDPCHGDTIQDGGPVGRRDNGPQNGRDTPIHPQKEIVDRRLLTI